MLSKPSETKTLSMSEGITNLGSIQDSLLFGKEDIKQNVAGCWKRLIRQEWEDLI